MPKLIVSGRFIKEIRKDSGFFDNRSFRFKNVGSHKLVVGCRKHRWNAKEKKCMQPVEVQSIRHPLSEFREKCRQGNCIIKESSLNR